jgi:hypothetical protein
MSDTDLQALLARNPNHPVHGVPVPLTLICNVTGKETKYTAPDYIKGKIQQAGSLEALLKLYKCKGAGKSGAAPAAKKAAPDVSGVDATLPKSRQTWRGNAVSTAKVDKPDAPPAELLHREYKFKDGPPCNVYFPRQSSEQLSTLVVALN